MYNIEQMSKRDLTNKYISFRSEHMDVDSKSPLMSNYDNSYNFNSQNSQNGIKKVDVKIENVVLGVQPSWMDKVKDIRNELLKTKDKINMLSVMQQKILMPNFLDDEDKNIAELDIVTNTIKFSLNATKNKIKLLGNDVKPNTVDYEIKKNMQITLATEFQTIGKEFIQNNNYYKERMQKRDSQYNYYNDIDNDIDISNNVDIETGLSKNSMTNYSKNIPNAHYLDLVTGNQYKSIQMNNAIDTNRILINERNKEITKIAEDIKEILEMFQDLGTLVVDQGTIMDRIDYNIYVANTNVDEGKKALVSSKKIATNSGKKLWIIFAMIFCIVLVFAITIKIIIS